MDGLVFRLMFLLYTKKLAISFPRDFSLIGKRGSYLKKIDPMMIFVLFAGTYTPVCLLALEGWWRTGMLLGIWTFALGAIFLKAFWINAPRWLSTGIYLLMGWLVVVAILPIYWALSFGGFVHLFLGGLFLQRGSDHLRFETTEYHHRAFRIP